MPLCLQLLTESIHSPKLMARFSDNRGQNMHSPLTLDENHAGYQIRGYSPGKILINHQVKTENLIVTPREISPFRTTNITDLQESDLALIIALKPDIVLMGTGSTLIFPTESSYGMLINHHIGVEFMNTSAACRTYNALTAENRNVLAALILR